MKSQNQFVYIIGIVLLHSCSNVDHETNSNELILNQQKDSSIIDSTRVDSFNTIEWKEWIDTAYCYGNFGMNRAFKFSVTDLDTLTEIEFDELEKLESTSLNKTSYVQLKDSGFAVSTKVSKINFTQYDNFCINMSTFEKQYLDSLHHAAWKYLGFVEPFYTHIIEYRIKNEILAGHTVMIDYENNNAYIVFAYNDGPPEIPILSLSESFLMFYSSSYEGAQLTILNNSRTKENSPRIKQFLKLELNGVLKQIAWLADDRICFEINEYYRNRENPWQTKYFTTKKPINELKWQENNR